MDRKINASQNTENMAKTMCKNYGSCNTCSFFASCDVKSFALRLNEAGYALKTDTITDFVEKVKNLLNYNESFHRGVFGWDTNEIKALLDLAAKKT